MSETTDSYRTGPQGIPARRLVIAVVALVVGTATIALAWPRLIAGVSDDPMEETLHSLTTPNPAPELVIQHMLAVKEQVTKVHATAKILADIALLSLRESLRVGPLTDEGKAALEASIAAHEKSLRYDPRNAYVWTRLGQALFVRDGASAENLGQVLETAVTFAPYDSRLVVARVDMSLAAWEQLSGATRSLMENQIHIAANQSPTALASLSRDRFALSRVTEILGDDPILLKRFIYAYAHS